MPLSDDPLLGDYLDECIERRRSQVRPTTLDGYRSAVRNHLRPRLGAVRLSGLDRREIERVYGRLLASGGRDGRPLSPRTVQHLHAILHRTLEDARLDGLVERNPAEHVRTPRRHAGTVEVDDDLRVWTAEQAARFLEAVCEHPLRALWHVALGTGHDAASWSVCDGRTWTWQPPRSPSAAR